MIELFTSYSISEIIIFLFIFFVAAKECISLFQYFKTLIKTGITQEEAKRGATESLVKSMERLELKYDQTVEEVHTLKEDYKNGLEEQGKLLNLLLRSDRDDIRGFIVDKHREHYGSKKWIDNFSMDVLEKRFEHYVEEGGNTYVNGLMEDLRSLPNSPEEKKQ